MQFNVTLVSNVSIKLLFTIAKKMNESNAALWDKTQVEEWLLREGFSFSVVDLLIENDVNGKCLLALNENDFNIEPLSKLTLGERKLLYISVRTLQRENHSSMIDLGLVDQPAVSLYTTHTHYLKQDVSEYCDSERSPPASEDGRSHKLKPEIFKAFLSFCYVVVVTWITAFVMVIVHDRVPDMKKYPPLPDIFLDNVPHIPWAFDMCEVTGTFLFSIWLLVLLFHKHR